MKRNHTSEELKKFIFDNIKENPSTISKLTSDKFGISRQSVNRHLSKLESAGLLRAEGQTRNRQYLLNPLSENDYHFTVDSTLEENKIWRDNVLPFLPEDYRGVLDICHYGFTEMMNNVIDHSESTRAMIKTTVYPNSIKLLVNDWGIGIFKKISRELQLEDERHAVLELSKGKLTTDKRNHSGEGIFFSSRMFDEFSILSGSLFFIHTYKRGGDWLLQSSDNPNQGTMVTMSISTSSTRTMKEVFDKYTSSDGNFGFTKTHVPVDLVRYGEEQLVSRSQAKRLLARLEPFKEIFLNFNGIDYIGQAFADEIFRVYKNERPDIDIIWVNTSNDIEKMIKRVMSNSVDDNQLKLDL